VWVQSGKGKKERKVPIARSALDWVDFYETKVRNEWLERGDHQNKLFINHRGRPISLSNCSERIKQYIQQIAPNHRGSCHLIRHSVATLLLENGCHIRFIQELLGHASLSSTECYAQVRVPHLSQSYAKYHPSMK
jgi:integrase/recombinase XerD